MDMIDNGLLKQMNINKKVLIDDVQRYIENENNDKSMIGNSKYSKTASLSLIATFEKNNFPLPTVEIVF